METDDYTLTDDVNLGEVTDEIDSDYSQTDLNNQLLIFHDRREIFESLEHRISKPYLEFLLQSVNIKDHDYWQALLQEISRIYSLNIGKIYADGILSTQDFDSEIVRLLIYLKIKLINNIELKKDMDGIIIDRNISRDDFEKYVEFDNAPEVMRICIKYIDGDSFKKFISRLFLELTLNFME